MLFMVIEHFKDGDAKPVYRRFRDRGRLMPDGLAYVDSWVDRDFTRCFQIVACADPAVCGGSPVSISYNTLPRA